MFRNTVHSHSPLNVRSRRWFLQTGLSLLGGPGLAQLLSMQAASAFNPGAVGNQGGGRSKKSVILFWLSGGPSQIDMWDPKPDAPREIRGPYGTISTCVPGIQFSEHLPLQASIADRLSIIRSVDCSSSNHTPITMQAGNPLARRTDNGRDGDGYPSMGSVAAKFRGANDRDLPAFVGLADSWAADVWESGQMGGDSSPVKGTDLQGRFAMPPGIEVARLQDRHHIRQQLDQFARRVENVSAIQQTDRYTQQAYDLVLSGKVQKAFQVDSEPAEIRQRYGSDSISQKALLARRLVEAGVTFVVVSGAWGYFDHHGDSVRWGGIEKGLTPLMPQVDRTLHAVVTDLEDRGMLDDTLVLMMGEFGRSPVINKDAGRDHWTNVMSMVVAGGGLKHGQVIGSTDSRGGSIESSPVRPQDLAATVFRHLEIDPHAHWINPQGRPIPVIVEGGRPIPELI